MRNKNSWQSDVRGHYLSRSPQRQEYKLTVHLAPEKHLYGCVGGPFAGARMWLAGSTYNCIGTMVFRLGQWHGRYAYNSEQTLMGDRKVVWVTKE